MHDLTITDGKVVEITLIADPERIRKFDIVFVGGITGSRDSQRRTGQ